LSSPVIAESADLLKASARIGFALAHSFTPFQDVSRLDLACQAMLTGTRSRLGRDGKVRGPHHHPSQLRINRTPSSTEFWPCPTLIYSIYYSTYYSIHYSIYYLACYFTCYSPLPDLLL
jgi:hypothetical protein